MAKKQDPDSKKFPAFGNQSLFGVAKELTSIKEINVGVDPKHENQEMYSCGSLAPKLKRGGGDKDYGVRDKVEPWESSDGAVFLLRELSAINPAEILKFLPTLAEIGKLDHFRHAPNLRETIFTCLPTILKNIGKANCKKSLEMFYDPMFITLKGDNRNAAISASECLVAIGKLIGPTILKGRLGEYRAEYATVFEKILKEAESPAPTAAMK